SHWNVLADPRHFVSRSGRSLGRAFTREPRAAAGEASAAGLARPLQLPRTTFLAPYFCSHSATRVVRSPPTTISVPSSVAPQPNERFSSFVICSICFSRRPKPAIIVAVLPPRPLRSRRTTSLPQEERSMAPGFGDGAGVGVGSGVGSFT